MAPAESRLRPNRGASGQDGLTSRFQAKISGRNPYYAPGWRERGFPLTDIEAG